MAAPPRILSFAVANHRSIRQRAEVSFVATPRKDEPAFTLPSQHAPHGTLPVLGVWGANASGKSNLLSALLFLRTVVQQSHARWEPTDPVPWWPWRLQRDSSPASEYELDFELDDFRYAFGFTVRAGAFTKEWLYRWEGPRRQVLFSRSSDGTAPWYFGPSLKGQRAKLAEKVRKNSLFLSVAAQENHPQLLPIYEALVSGILPCRPIGLSGFPLFPADHPILAEGFRPTLLRFLAAADLGVSDITVEEHRPIPPPEGLKKLFTPEALAQINSPPEDLRLVRLLRGKNDPWSLPPEDESRGTQILLARLADLLPTMLQGGLVVVDELDTSLHPDLCVALVRLFTDPRSNRNGAQLLFTTHDRDILEVLRTDEVVLVDKDGDGASVFRAASDYKQVRTRESLRRVHAEGRLRGVPILGDLAEVLEEGPR